MAQDTRRPPRARRSPFASLSARRRRASCQANLDGLREHGFRIVGAVPWSGGVLDHVVIGPTGAFALQIRSWRGRVHVQARRLRQGTRDVTSEIHRVSGAAGEVEQRLARSGIVTSVEPILVLSNARLMHERIRLGAVSVIHADDLAAVVMAGTNWLLDEQLDPAAQVLGGAS